MARLFVDMYGNYAVLEDDEMVVLPYDKLTAEQLTSIEETSDSNRIRIAEAISPNLQCKWGEVYDTLQEAIRLSELPATPFNNFAIKEALHLIKEGLGY